MSELYGTSETAEPVSEVSATPRHEASSEAEPADISRDYPDAAQHEAYTEADGYGSYSDADIEAILAEEERLPEARTRQDVAASTWDDTTDDPAESGLATGYDGDVEALLAEEERLPEAQTRQDAAAGTWDTSTDQGNDDPRSFSGDPASEYDGDVEALLSHEEHLPEPRTRQEVRIGTWGDTNGQDPDVATSLDANTDASGLAESDAVKGGPEAAQPGGGMSTATANEIANTGAEAALDHPQGATADDVSSPDQTVVAVHDQQGHDWPLTVVHLGPEDRTLGEGTMSGIGLKPTGEQLREMEGDDPSENRADRFFGKAFELMDDVHDATSHIAEAIQEDLPHGSAQQPSSHTSYVVHDQPTPPPDASGAGDMVANLTVLGVMTVVGFRHLFGHRRKEDKA